MRIARWVRQQLNGSDWLLYLATASVTGILTIAALELWSMNLAVPLTYWGDALPTAAHFKTVLETGWYEYQPLLGAPYGQTYNDFPTADNLNFMAARLIGLFARDYVVALNLYFILGFVAASLTSLWLFRRLGVSRGVSLALAVAFALAPYHFYRGESHLWLASYYVIPLSIGLVVMVLRDEPVWRAPTSGRNLWRWLTSRTGGTVLIVALTATAQSYYAVFFLILIAFAGVARLIATGRWRLFWGAAAAGIATAVGMLFNMLPDIIYSAVNGQNAEALARGHIDSEIFALKLTQLLLPWPGHRVDALRDLRVLYDSTYPLASEYPALGFLGALGLVAAFLILAYRATTVVATRTRPSAFLARYTLVSQLAALVFVCFVFSTMGGLSTLVSFLTTSLRGWNRMSIVIALLCLAIIGILIDAGICWIVIRRRASSLGATWLAVLVAVGLVGVVYIDQTPEAAGSGYDETIKMFEADDEWFGEIDELLPAGVMVLQLPYLPFPEGSSVTGVLSSDTLIPYLHSTDISWSGGGIKGRPRADWPSMLENHPPKDIVALTAAAGFSGILLDSKAMADADFAQLASGLRSVVSTAPITSDDYRYVFFDLQPEVATLTAKYPADQVKTIANSVVDPLVVDASSFAETVSENDTMVAQSGAENTPLTLTSARKAATRATLSFTLTLEDPSLTGVTARVTLPDGTKHNRKFVDNRATFSIPVDVRPGTSTVTVTTKKPRGDVPATIAINDLLLQDLLVENFLHG